MEMFENLNLLEMFLLLTDYIKILREHKTSKKIHTPQNRGLGGRKTEYDYKSKTGRKTE